ncbi:MAG: lipocalin family protein [Gammaproteobacteria bacterium]|jgi:apolipoprotein D and lipocalin family protein
MNRFIRLLCVVPLGMLNACSTTSTPLRTVDAVDLPRFMGDWYVIASIPTFIERDAYNAVESYELVDARRVATTFRFNQGSLDGPVRIYRPTGFVGDDPSNAVWGMQFIWPIKADYRVMYLDADYTQTVIGRNKRDYVWIMARTPTIAEEDYEEILRLIAQQGYDITEIRRVPQRQPATGASKP